MWWGQKACVLFALNKKARKLFCWSPGFNRESRNRMNSRVDRNEDRDLESPRLSRSQRVSPTRCVPAQSEAHFGLATRTCMPRSVRTCYRKVFRKALWLKVDSSRQHRRGMAKHLNFIETKTMTSAASVSVLFMGFSIFYGVFYFYGFSFLWFTPGIPYRRPPATDPHSRAGHGQGTTKEAPRR